MSRKMGSVYTQVTLSQFTWLGALQGAGAPGCLMSNDMQRPCGWFFLWKSLEARKGLWLSVVQVRPPGALSFSIKWLLLL